MRIFSFILPVRVSGLLFSELALTFCCYLAAAAFVLGGEIEPFLMDEMGVARLLIVSLSVLLGLFVNNLYADTRVESRVLLVLKLCSVVGIAFIVQGLLTYAAFGLSLPRLVMTGGSLLVFLTLALWRIFYGQVFLKMLGTRDILFVGEDHVMEEIALRIEQHPELGIGVCGFLSDRAPGEREHLANGLLGKYLGGESDLEAASARCKPHRIVIGSLESGQTLPVSTLLRLARSGILIEEAATTYESVCGRVCSGSMQPQQIIFHNELAQRPGSLALQSVYTNLLALAAILLMSPLLILISLAIKLTSRGPLFDTDVRVGQHGIPFNLNRFRCHRLASSGNAESPDGLLTPVGRLLQRYRLANLPRVLNLLRGEITLVGPRPERPEFADELAAYFAFYRQRHAVKPGMTGWSQINTVDSDKRTDSLIQLEYDLYYTKHFSLALDAYILLHGMRRMLPFSRH